MMVAGRVAREPTWRYHQGLQRRWRWILNVVPVADVAAINSEEMIRPTIAAQKPENMYTKSFT